MTHEAPPRRPDMIGNNLRQTHGHASVRSTTYRTWEGMRARCSNPSDPHYPDYGGRGITVCERWRDSFEAFLADMGQRPPGLTLDREKVDGNYEPDNCRWATAKEQARNRRSNTVIEFDGRKQSVAAWCEELGVDYPTVVWRLKRGWSVTDALTRPNRLRPRAAT